jgi:hypothetical protein
MPRLEGLPLLIYHSVDDPLVPLSNGLRLYQAARPPRLFQPTRGGHAQTFADPAWRQLMLLFMSDPRGFVERHPSAEVSNPETLE